MYEENFGINPIILRTIFFNLLIKLKSPRQILNSKI